MVLKTVYFTIYGMVSMYADIYSMESPDPSRSKTLMDCSMRCLEDLYCGGVLFDQTGVCYTDVLVAMITLSYRIVEYLVVS